MARSQNGWTANDSSVVSTRTVPGTNVRLAVRDGIPGDLLIEVAVAFHRLVEPIEGNGWHKADDWGFAKRLIRGGLRLSNHASATAIDLNATRHPLGVRNTFTAGQKTRMHAFLRELDGTVRWGEDYLIRKDGMHFELMTTDVARLRDALATARRLNQGLKKVEPGTRTLSYKRGRAIMQGTDVQVAQKAVNVVQDGYYGPATALAVKRYQKLRKITPRSGDVGPRTWARMGHPMKEKAA